ncbi:MAG: oligopeptide:H+ symporter [Bacteroidetes bacterium]|nr:oligopeptide:H+ symporter [Bacteroidota bacterium]
MENIASAPKGHPKGLYLLFTVEMWERFSYYGMRAVLSLYMAAAAVPMFIDQNGEIKGGGLGLQEDDSSLIMGFFQAFVYLTPLIGGWLADQYLGQRRSVVLGGIIMMLGQFALFAEMGVGGFIAGLTLLCIGNGFFKPNISTIVGNLYPENDPRRDGGFTIFYMGINLGALIAPFICGYFGENIDFGYRYGFLAAGVGMLLGLITLWVMGDRILGDLGKVPAAKLKKAKDAADAAAGMAAPAKGFTKIEKDRLWVIGILVFFSTFFWAGFDQAPTSMNYYTRDYINRNVGGALIPTSFFQSINPFLIITLAFVFSALWVWLDKRGKNPSTPAKMGIGITLLGIGFLFMVGAALDRGPAAGLDPNVKAGIFWVVFAYVLHTMGELCLSPVGLSMITKLSPARLTSLMMGVWFLSVFLANLLGGWLAGFIAIPKESNAPEKAVVRTVYVKPNQEVAAGDKLYVLSIQNKDTTLTAPFAGTIPIVSTTEGATVEKNATIVYVAPKGKVDHLTFFGLFAGVIMASGLFLLGISRKLSRMMHGIH